MLNVACVLRSGGRYDQTWVERLSRMVGANLTVPHDFVCLTDMPVGIESLGPANGDARRGAGVIPLPENAYPGWWSKLYLFDRVLMGSATKVLYFDLDVVITGNLDAIASVDVEGGGLFIPRDFANPKVPGTCVMVYEPDAALEWNILRDFAPVARERTSRGTAYGDQDWIGERAVWWPLNDVCPGQVVSYKLDLLRFDNWKPGIGWDVGNARVIAFHGEPKMNQLPEDHGLRRLWEDGGSLPPPTRATEA